MEIAINIPAVLVAAIISVVLGSLWYGPLFGKTWMRLIGISMPEVMTPAIKKQMVVNYASQIIGSLLMAFVFATVYAAIAPHLTVTGVSAGIKVAVIIWLGLVASVQLPMTLWEGRPVKYFWITSGFYLVYLVIIGVLFALWP